MKGTAVTKVRTTINPLTELEVNDRQLRELRDNGLLLDTQATTDAGILRAAERQSADRESPVGINAHDHVSDLTTVENFDDNAPDTENSEV